MAIAIIATTAPPLSLSSPLSLPPPLSLPLPFSLPPPLSLPPQLHFPPTLLLPPPLNYHCYHHLYYHHHHQPNNHRHNQYYRHYHHHNQVTITTHVFSRPGGKRFVCLNSLIKIQLLTIVQACGKHLCGLVVSTDEKFSERLARSSYSGGWVFFLERLVLLTQEERDSFLFHSQYILCLFSCKDIVVSNSCYCLSQK